MAKYHINQKDGTVGACRAEQGKCPFGSDDEHYTSIVAAAKAYEDSMSDQTFQSSSKRSSISELPNYGFTLKDPDHYYFAPQNLDRYEAQEYSNYGYPGKTIYSMLRNELGPSFTHYDASIVMDAWKRKYESPGGQQIWDNIVKEDPSAKDTYKLVRKFVDPNNEKLPSPQEFKDSLVERTRAAILAKRDYGFPEDEMTRSFQDKKERALLEAMETMTGEDASEIRMKLLSTAVVSRDFENYNEKAINDRINHIEGLTRVSRAKRQELWELKREKGIRAVLAAKSGGPMAPVWRLAREENQKGHISQREALSLLGAPSKKDIDLMDDDVKRFWTGVY